jgi:PAS domain S-box-containing protein
MATDQTIQSTPSLDKQLKGLSMMAGKMRSALLPMRTSLPPNVIDELSQMEARLHRASLEVGSVDEERKNLFALADIGQVINSTLKLDEVLRIVMDTIVRLTGAERGFLMLANEKGEMVTQIARNWEQESLNNNETAISRTVIKRVIESGVPVMTTNAKEDPRFNATESIIAYKLRSILCVPLMVKSYLIGVIYTDNRLQAGIFREPEKDLITAFANQAAVAIENARLFASLRKTLEEVTELKNLMDNVFASITSGVITADIEDQITLANRAAETIIGKTTADIVGRRLDEVFPAIADDILPRVATVRISDKAITDMELNHRHPQRGNLNWRLNLSPLKDGAQVTQGVTIVLDDLTERKRLEGQRKLFERMVSPAVIHQLDPDSISLVGRRTDITVLFADIRGFTSFSEQHSPEKLVSILNRYLAAAAEAVLDQEGTVDKFLGDAVMAWFNAPIPQVDHTLRAVRAAVTLRDSVLRLHAELPPEAKLSFGVGIHYGDAVLGLIGTEKRLEYTAIGDCVNTAKRLQENAWHNQIVISQTAYERVRDYLRVLPMDPLQVKGKRDPIPVYEILGFS